MMDSSTPWSASSLQQHERGRLQHCPPLLPSAHALASLVDVPALQHAAGRFLDQPEPWEDEGANYGDILSQSIASTELDEQSFSFGDPALLKASCPTRLQTSAQSTAANRATAPPCRFSTPASELQSHPTLTPSSKLSTPVPSASPCIQQNASSHDDSTAWHSSNSAIRDGSSSSRKPEAPNKDSSDDGYANVLPKRLKHEEPAHSPVPPAKAQVLQSQMRKVGEKITTLQQLVSPFGKTDTASVLLEAIGYIKFLQEQVQILSSPYMTPTISRKMSGKVKSASQVCEDRTDLRSKGLCLVPISCTMNVANHNGADYWISGVGGCNS